MDLNISAQNTRRYLQPSLGEGVRPPPAFGKKETKNDAITKPKATWEEHAIRWIRPRWSSSQPFQHVSGNFSTWSDPQVVNPTWWRLSRSYIHGIL